MKNKKLIIMASLILIFTVLFCTVCNGIKKADDYTGPYPEKSEITEITEISTETIIPNIINDDTSDISETSTSTFHTEGSTSVETTRREPATRENTTVPSATSASPLKRMLVNGEWHFTTPDGKVNCRFFNDGTYEVYDKNGNADGGGYYSIDGNIVYIYDYCGNILNCFEYNEKTNTFTSLLPSCEATTASAPATTNPALNSSNVSSLLWDAVECYDLCVNCTTFNLEYNSFGEYIVCPHCGEQAFLVLNYYSRSDIENYINKYLWADAKEYAEQGVEELFNYGMLTEYNGRLYVCSAYNDRGYCGFDKNTIRLISENSDGSYTIAVDDLDYEETYYLDVYCIDGGYKIG